MKRRGNYRRDYVLGNIALVVFWGGLGIVLTVYGWWPHALALLAALWLAAISRTS